MAAYHEGRVAPWEPSSFPLVGVGETEEELAESCTMSCTPREILSPEASSSVGPNPSAAADHRYRMKVNFECQDTRCKTRWQRKGLLLPLGFVSGRWNPSERCTSDAVPCNRLDPYRNEEEGQASLGNPDTSRDDVRSILAQSDAPLQ